MPFLESEREVIAVLQLEKYGQQFPVPEDTKNNVIRLDGKDYSQEAIRAALDGLEATIFRELAEYPHVVFSHNNVEGHGGSGGTTSLMRALLFSATPEIRGQIFQALDQENR